MAEFSTSRKKSGRCAATCSSTDWLEVLPEQLWLHALGFLSIQDLLRVRQVSKSIRKYAEHALSEVKCLSRVGLPFKLDDTALAWLATQCPQLQVLDVSACSLVSDEGLQHVGAHCRSIQVVNITDCSKVTDEGVSAIANPQLRHVFASGSKITDVTLLVLAETCKQLQILAVGNCAVSDVGLLSIGANCTSLIYFNCFGCTQGVSDVGIEHIAENSRELEELEISNCQQISDRSLIAVSRHTGEGVKMLYAAFCPELRDTGLRQLAEGGTQLEELHLSGCIGLSSRGLQSIGLCSKLRSLHISSCDVDSSALQAIAKGCAALETLDLSFCTGINDLAIQLLTKHCPQMQRLSMAFGREVSDVSLQAISENCPKLVSLDCSNCRQISNVGVEAVAEKCRMLQVLSIERCHLVTDQSIAKLIANQPNLHSLNVSHLPVVTDEGLGHLASCPALRSLRMASCSSVTDNTLRVLGTHCRLLETLIIPLNPNITDDGILAIGEGCLRLITLNVSCCRRVTAAGLEVVRSNCPSLKWLLHQHSRSASPVVDRAARLLQPP
uniref:F-box family protein n=1 Tax=Chlorokybus atmophyticus TaxID=3144 RepID=I6PI02_CHLAT|nr:F-box family protein [Chlorokybus atmophyticus]